MIATAVATHKYPRQQGVKTTMLPESKSGTALTATAIVDASGNVWSLVLSASSGNQVVKNGVVDTTTANVAELFYSNHLVYHKNTAGNWWVYSTGWTSSADPTIAKASSSGATINGTTGSLVDASGVTWTLVSSASSGLQIARNGVVDSTTANVALLLWYNGVVSQENSAGGWWSWVSNAWQSIVGDPRPAAPTTPTGRFYVSNGQIIDPTGKVWVGKGINVADWAAVGGGGPGNVGNGTKPVDGSGNPQNGMDGQYVFSLFQNCNIVRLGCSYALAHDASGYNDSPSSLMTFVNNLTARKCVVVIDDHPGSSPGIPQGANSSQQSWWRAMAAAFASNPYVWYGTLNEPWGNASADAICQNQLDTYNTLRGAGVTAPILLEICNPPVAWGASWAGPQAHYFSGMQNVVWDLHIYGGTGGSTQGQAANNAAITSAVGAVFNNGITSKDGKIPVIIGEYGPSTTGSGLDANGPQNVIAVLAAAMNGTVAGTIAWAWEAGNWNVQNQGYRTNFGNVVNDAFNGKLATSWTA
jgi:hypothetical protein